MTRRFVAGSCDPGVSVGPVSAAPLGRVSAGRNQSFRRPAGFVGMRVNRHSGNGWPRVSGAKGKAARPIRKTAHIVTPA